MCQAVKEKIPGFESSDFTATLNVVSKDPKYRVTFSPTQSQTNGNEINFQDTQFATVLKNERLTASSWNQDVRHIVVEADSILQNYSSGDVFDVYPENGPEHVDNLLRTQFPNVNGDAILLCQPPLEAAMRLPESVRTLRNVLNLCLDIHGLPTRLFFERASHFCEKPDDGEKMLEYASSKTAEDAAQYTVYCKRERRSYLEVLVDFPSCKIPVGRFLEWIPILRPRSFSISSSPKAHAGEIHITVAMVEYLTPWKRMKHGLCSTFLSGIPPGSRMRCAIKVNPQLRLPSGNFPLILVGTGTGCAPMRSLVYERAFAHPETTKAEMYFGCRSQSNDFLYGNEWPLVTSRFCVAFSKDNNKCRVPQLLARDGEQIYRKLFVEKGSFFVCGSAKRMPADVRETLVQIIMKWKPFDENGVDTRREDAVNMIRALERERRYVVEAWS